MASLEGQIVPSELAAEDLEALRAAVRRLERESLATRFAQLAGKSAGLFDRFLPRVIGDAASFATQSALRASLKLALSSSLSRWRDKSGRWHKALATLAGATGGALGLPALVAELPVTTSLLMHAIADIGRRGKIYRLPKASSPVSRFWRSAGAQPRKSQVKAITR